MSPSSRMRVWGGAVASGHLALGLTGWIVLGVAPWFFGGCAVLTLFVTLVAAPLMDPHGGGPGGGDGPGPGPPEPEPPWWPEFERDLRAHLEARDRLPA